MPRVHRTSLTVAFAVALTLIATTLPGQQPVVRAGGPAPAVPASPPDGPSGPPISGGPVVLPSGDVLPVMPSELARPGVQAEMLAQHDRDALIFPAATPSAVNRPAAASALPLGGVGSLAALPNGLQKEIFGFLPYWMLDAAELQWLRYDLVSTIGFFGIAAQADGSLAVGSNGWNGWYSSALSGVVTAAHDHGVRVVLTVTMMAWDGGTGQAALLGDMAARARLVDAIVSAVRDRNADGINLDFEPVYTPQRDQYTSFVRQLKAGLVAAGVGAYLTVCTTAGAATWATGYDLGALVSPGAADGIFVMGYDYSWSGSSRAGGVAPIESPYMLDVNQSVNDYLKVVSGSKIIWGVPYYGRTWRTTSDALNASTQPGASASSVAYHYTGNQVLQAQYGRRWDPVGQVPWFAYWDPAAASWVEGYYDDAVSLEVKWDMVNQRGLAGTGMWTLLMDQGSPDLWNLLASKFLAPSTPPSGAASTYVSLLPSRVLDTRAANGLSGSFSAGVPRTFQVSGQGGVPEAAVAVTGNLTVTNQTGAGYVYLGPNPVASPTSSTLNFPVGDNRANGVTIALSPTGSLSATYSAAGGSRADLVFDVTGYFVP